MMRDSKGRFIKGSGKSKSKPKSKKVKGGAMFPNRERVLSNRMRRQLMEERQQMYNTLRERWERNVTPIVRQRLRDNWPLLVQSVPDNDLGVWHNVIRGLLPIEETHWYELFDILGLHDAQTLLPERIRALQPLEDDEMEMVESSDEDEMGEDEDYPPSLENF